MWPWACSPLAGVLYCTFIALGPASLLPRAGGRAHVRGLAPRAGQGVQSAVTELIERLVEQSAADSAAQLLRQALAGPPVWSHQQRDAWLAALTDGATGDDGGGVGVEVHTGTEDMNIPGRYERHYTPEALRGIFERAGWRVRQCELLNRAGEAAAGDGAYVYVTAVPRAT